MMEEGVWSFSMNRGDLQKLIILILALSFARRFCALHRINYTANYDYHRYAHRNWWIYIPIVNECLPLLPSFWRCTHPSWYLRVKTITDLYIFEERHCVSDKTITSTSLTLIIMKSTIVVIATPTIIVSNI